MNGGIIPVLWSVPWCWSMRSPHRCAGDGPRRSMDHMTPVGRQICWFGALAGMAEEHWDEEDCEIPPINSGAFSCDAWATSGDPALMAKRRAARRTRKVAVVDIVTQDSCVGTDFRRRRDCCLHHTIL